MPRNGDKERNYQMNRYKEAGVDVTAGYDLVNRIKPMVAATKRKGVRGWDW